jgi:hypothetical protein
MGAEFVAGGRGEIGGASVAGARGCTDGVLVTGAEASGTALVAGATGAALVAGVELLVIEPSIIVVGLVSIPVEAEADPSW